MYISGISLKMETTANNITKLLIRKGENRERPTGNLSTLAVR
jgi:hypothetical protein